MLNSSDMKIDPKPVETIPASTLMDEAKKTLEAISQKDLDKINADAGSIKTKFHASDWLNVIKGFGAQKALDYMGLGNNSGKISSTVFIIILVLVAALLIYSYFQ